MCPQSLPRICELDIALGKEFCRVSYRVVSLESHGTSVRRPSSVQRLMPPLLD
jgi:hypothetical protein